MKSLLFILGLLFSSTANADPVVIKLATMAPEGTAWYNGLRQMGDRWEQISNGEVKLKIYAGGVAGNEGTMVRKMRIGQLQGAALTNLGILDIDPAPQVLNTPMLIRSYDELDYVMDKVSPIFEERLKEKDFVVVNWGEAGWAHFFTNQPMRTPQDASKIKVFAWEGDPGAVAAFRQAGFNPVVIPSVDMVPSLQSGLIDGFPNTPLAALSLQWFALAPNMLDVPWAPLVGATVITESAWDSIPAQYHEPFLVAAKEIGDSLKDEIRRQDTKAIEVMKRYGLQVIEVDEATKKAWVDLSLSIYPIMRGTIVPEDVFDKTVKAVEEYRQK